MTRIALALALLLFVPAAAEARWTWPARGEVITPFAVRGDPFAPGQHRGIDIAVRAGARVAAPCAGRVRYAGRVPGRGRGVTLVCGRVAATVLELATTARPAGAVVAAGATIGTAGASHVQLGARRLGERHGYLDPRTLLQGAATSPPPGLLPPPSRPRPSTPAPRTPTPRPAAVSNHAPQPAATPERSTAEGPREIPRTASAGLALLAAATPLGATLRRRKAKRRPSASVATAAAR